MPGRIVDITPDLSLMEKLGSVGFAPEEALAEFVDNSIDALYDENGGSRAIRGPAVVSLSLQPERLVISDSSCGIKDFDNCLRSAWSEKKGGQTLGQFGLGMKTAAMSLGRRVTIRSKRLGETSEYRTTLDLGEWYKGGHWSLLVEDYDAKKADHYTEITIEELHVNPQLYLHDLSDRLGERFGPLIEDGQVEILVNDRKVTTEPISFLDAKDAAMGKAVKECGSHSPL
jgi:Histidine kinase-, DNA gyrase B-, and HSP90-like ATPase